MALFTRALFAGVLDAGEDAVFIGEGIGVLIIVVASGVDTGPGTRRRSR